MEAVATTAGIVIVLGILFMLALRLSLSLARRDICKVIWVFRQHNAVRRDNAITLEKTGILRRPLFTLLRDYRPWAFQTLVQAGIIREAIEGFFYLSEEQLGQALGIQCPL